MSLIACLQTSQSLHILDAMLVTLSKWLSEHVLSQYNKLVERAICQDTECDADFHGLWPLGVWVRSNWARPMRLVMFR
jgi:hypothetical protein